MQRILKAMCTQSAIGLLVSCAPPEVTAVKSPDGVMIAKLVDYRGGGPTTSADQRVVVEEEGHLFRPVVKVFEGENTEGRSFGDLNVSWLNAETLILGYCDGDIANVEKNAQIGSHHLEVRIVQEKRKWPASIPPERRNGPPPCA